MPGSPIRLTPAKQDHPKPPKLPENIRKRPIREPKMRRVKEDNE